MNPAAARPAVSSTRPHRGRKVLRTAAPAAMAAAISGFAVPHSASCHSVRAGMQAMTRPQALLAATAAAASMASYWFMTCAVLPSIRVRQAAAVNPGCNAVTSTLPAAGALALGVSWAMLSSWGASTADYVLCTLVPGTWNIFARLGLPVLALVVLVMAGRPGAGLIAAAAAGLALLATAAAGPGLLLRSEPFAARAGHALQPRPAIGGRLVRRPPPPDVTGSLPGFRDRTAGPLAARGWRITAATAASQLARWLVLLACLRATGLSPAQVPWQTSLAAFAFAGLLTAVPITPGGAGITEPGLAGFLAAGAGPGAGAQVTAAVLLYRAVTYLPPIPLGAAACLVWRHAPALIHASPPGAGPGSLRRDGRARDTAGATGQPAGMIPSALAGRGPDGLWRSGAA